MLCFIKKFFSLIYLHNHSSIISSKYFYGISWWFMLSFGMWHHSGLFHSYFTSSCWVNFLNMKAVKESYEISQEEKIEGQYIFYILPFFWVQQPFNGWGNSSWLRMKWLRLQGKLLKCVSRSWIYLSKFAI